jgi:hypothetical protein
VRLREHYAWTHKGAWLGAYGLLSIFGLGAGHMGFATWLLGQPIFAAMGFFMAPGFDRDRRVARGEAPPPHVWRRVGLLLLALVAISALAFVFRLGP